MADEVRQPHEGDETCILPQGYGRQRMDGTGGRHGGIVQHGLPRCCGSYSCRSWAPSSEPCRVPVSLIARLLHGCPNRLFMAVPFVFRLIVSNRLVSWLSHSSPHSSPSRFVAVPFVSLAVPFVVPFVSLSWLSHSSPLPIRLRSSRSIRLAPFGRPYVTVIKLPTFVIIAPGACVLFCIICADEGNRPGARTWRHRRSRLRDRGYDYRQIPLAG